MFAAAQFGKVSLTLNEHAAVFDRSPTGVALFVSLVGLVGLFCGAAAGAIVAWLSPRTSLLIGLVLSAAVSLAQSFLPPAEVYAALRLLEGVPHLTLVVAAPPIMAMIATDRDRPVVMSIWAMFFGLSFALSALIVPALLEWGGLPLVLRAHGIGFLVLLVLLWGQLPPHRSHSTFVKYHPLASRHLHLTSYCGAGGWLRVLHGDLHRSSDLLAPRFRTA